MTRTEVIQKLLMHGPLTRKQIREITGYTELQIKYVMRSLAAEEKIVSKDRLWYRCINGNIIDGQTDS